MKLLYLGTGAAEGWPGLFCQCAYCKEATRRGGPNIRRRSGALIDGKLLIDLSPDLYYAKVSFGLDLGSVRHILITHRHSDHFQPFALEMNRAPYAHLDAPGIYHVYGSEETRKGFEEQTAEFRKALDGVVAFETLAPFSTYTVGDYTVTPLPGRHGCTGTLIYAIEREGRRLLYAHDTGIFEEPALEALRAMKPFDTVSMDCTNGPILSSYTGHMGFEQNIALKEKLLAQGSAHAGTHWICNHFSHNGGMLYEEMVQHMRPEGFDISFDGMTVDI